MRLNFPRHAQTVHVYGRENGARLNLFCRMCILVCRFHLAGSDRAKLCIYS